MADKIQQESDVSSPGSAQRKVTDHYADDSGRARRRQRHTTATLVAFLAAAETAVFLPALFRATATACRNLLCRRRPQPVTGATYPATHPARRGH